MPSDPSTSLRTGPAAPVGASRRLHPYSIVFAFLTQLRLFVVPGILLAVGIGTGGDGWWRPWMMLLIIPNAVVAVVGYLSYRYEYGADELIIRSGMLFRRERHIPYDRIQNIDAVQNVLHRLLQVVKIDLETGGGSEAEASLSVVPLSALEEMRQRVMAARQQSPAKTPPVVDQAPLLQLSTRELLLSGLIDSRGGVLFAAGFGLLWEFGMVNRITGRLDPPELQRGPIRTLVRGLYTNASEIVDRLWIAVAGAFALLLLIRILSMVWSVVRLHGFTLRLIDQDARADFGLLTRVAHTIPRRRIQVLTIREGPWHRLLSRASVKVDTAGGTAGDEPGSRTDRESLAPIIHRDTLHDFVSAVIGVDLGQAQWNSSHPRAFRREVMPWLAVTAVLSGVAIFYGGSYALPVLPVLVAWAIVVSRQTVKHLRWAEVDGAILQSRGWVWRRLILVPTAKIQVATYRQSPFDRRHRMAAVHVDTAGATSASIVYIPYLDQHQGRALHQRLSTAASETQFKW